MPNVVRADVMTYGAQNFTDYLADLRAKADIAASPSLSDSAVLAHVQSEFLKRGMSVVNYQYLGDDSNGAPVYRLGSLISLQDLSTQLEALVDDGSITRVPGADFAYSCNPHLRK